MKRRILVGMALIGTGLAASAGYAQEPKKEEKAVTLKSVLLEQLRSTHNKKEWFVDAMTAVNGLTPEQASWRDGKGNHSAGQLMYHLVFWNRRSLAKFKASRRRNSAAITRRRSTALMPRRGALQCGSWMR